MKGLLALLLGGFGLGAWFERRRRRAAAEASPADELRARLAETRSAPEPLIEEPPPPADDPEARRRAVHERARRDLDDLA